VGRQHEKGLASARDAIDSYNDALRDGIAEFGPQRRTHLQPAQTGFPVRQRRHTAAVTRRGVSRPPVNDTGRPEPFLADDAEYEDALRVLINIRTAG
jgi:hypothetical protein